MTIQNIQNINIGLATILDHNSENRIEEWIKFYHDHIKINKFIIYLDNCNNNTKNILEKLKHIDGLDIDILKTNYYSSNIHNLHIDQKTQYFYTQTIQNYKTLDYIAFFEINEFLIPQTKLSFINFLSTIKIPCVYVNSWEYLGSFNETKPILGQSYLRWTDFDKYNSVWKCRGKSVIKPSLFRNCDDKHHFTMFNGLQANESENGFNYQNRNIQVVCNDNVIINDELFRIASFRNDYPKNIKYDHKDNILISYVKTIPVIFNFIKEDIITNDKYLTLTRNNNIKLIKTDVVKYDKEIEWRGKKNNLEPSHIWITSHSDYCIDKEIFDKYQSQCKLWFCNNKNYKNPKLIALPVGITNDCDDTPIHRIFGNTNIMMDIVNTIKKRKNLVYMNFSIETNHQERFDIFNSFKDKEWVTKGQSNNTLEGRKQFLIDLYNHDFILYPQENGIDCHIFWETLYMGSIPIITRHIGLNDIFKDLPVCWIDNWNIITKEFLNNEYTRIKNTRWNMEKLKITYWINMIKNCLPN